MPRIIPCLDVRDGRVVKGINFQNLRADFNTFSQLFGLPVNGQSPPNCLSP